MAGLILTWQRDPSSTMTIDWHETSPLEKPVLLHRRKGTDAWKSSTPVEDRPVIAAIGNHEVNSAVAPYYEANFAFPAEETYGALDLGDYRKGKSRNPLRLQLLQKWRE